MRTVLVTGATDGLGRRVAAELAARGEHVLVHGRNPEKLERTAAETGGEPLLADLASLAQVRRLAASVDERVDLLVNNVGVIVTERRTSEDGYELTFAVNHLAHFLLTLELRPGRVVNVASAAQERIDFDDLMLERGYSGMRAYSRSKLAQVMFTFELAERGTPANALHPATLMDTNMVRGAYGTATSSVEEGAAATLELIDRDDVSGRWFDRTREARAHRQAYDPEARRRLWEVSEELAGLG